MSASNFGDSMEWGRGRSSPSSSGSKRGKRGGSSVDKTRQPQRGLGVAQLEKIRLQSEMVEYLHHPPPAGQQPPSLIHGAGGFNLQEDAWSSSASSSFHTHNINIPPAYSIHPNFGMAYNGGRSGDMRYGESPSTTPISRSTPNYHVAAAFCGAPHYSHPSSDATLPLFEPEDSIGFKGHHDLNHSLTHPSEASTNSDDPQDVDLELKLWS